jgi:glycosyltransferase involved in cell wall biosynthesis
MKTYARELSARLPRVAPEFEYVQFSSGRNFGWDEQIRLPLAIRQARLDLMHFLSIYVPLMTPARSVLTVHDLIHLRFPAYFKAKVRPYYEVVVRRACARAKRVITDDERTVEDLERFLGVDRAKVRVVPLGVDERFTRPIVPHTGPRRYLLYVGNHREHKNIATLFEAWSSLPQELEIDLYLTGPDDFDGELQRRSTGARKAVALGDVAMEALAGYYAGARALVQPALREGFGLPMLEAMASGCPVVASKEAAPRVLAPAVLSFDAGDAVQLAALLRRVIDDEELRDRFVGAGRTLARTLGWDRCARATADVYREAMDTP